MRRPPEVVVLSAGANGHRLAGSLMDRAGPACHHLEAVAGDLGTVGGLLAVVSAATACRLAGPAGAAALALAVSGAGDVIAVELNVG
jgi:hypothetical protein